MRKFMTFFLVLALVMLHLFLIVGCKNTPPELNSKSPKFEENETVAERNNGCPDSKDDSPKQSRQNTEDEKEIEEDKEAENSPALTEQQLQEIQPNELGEIMILMYHRIGSQELDWERHYNNFRKDLERLYSKGYRPINLQDLIDNQIDLDPGYTPFILTFDDSTPGQFRYIEENGELVIDPQCAVGIMKDFNKENPDFALKGTFYTNYSAPPFRQAELVKEKLEFLVDKGMEIGNHTYNHINLRNASIDTMQKELGHHAQKTREYIPGYQIRSLALPYGGIPPADKEPYVYSGQYEDVTYKNEAVLLVGSNPTPAPNHKNFNLKRLPRIRGSQDELDRWFNYFNKYPERRYVSDGDPDNITFPEELKDSLEPESLGNKEIRTYDLP